MKLSLAWIFDHLNASWQDQNINNLITRFNSVVAEIESFYPVAFDLTNFALGTIESIEKSCINIVIPELQQKLVLPLRELHEQTGSLNNYLGAVMVKRTDEGFVWATLADFGLEKGGLLPLIHVAQEDLAGKWKMQFETTDIIIEVDNKSITHRPDMWCHRGFAREIASFLNLPFKESTEFLATKRILSFDKNSQPTLTNQFTIENQADNACHRFAGLHAHSVQNKACDIFIASRLMKIGSRPINALVDLANYVMFDWSNPIHLYDASKIEGNKIVIRMAHDQEPLVLLDGAQAILREEDLVIADTKKPLCLAGVMGGAHSAVTMQTTSLLLEAAAFDPGIIRKTALHHKQRTDASARFEKTLDPNLALEVVQRFVQLATTHNISMTWSDEICITGPAAKEVMIEVSHDFFEQRSGVLFKEHEIIDPLERLGFKVLRSSDFAKNRVYVVSVPSFRASKDIKIKEDLLEEVVRCYGFGKIPLYMQKIEPKPSNLTSVMRLRKIKSYLAYAANMTEQQNYSLYYEPFMSQLGIKFNPTVSLINPLSEQMYRLIDSLIPGLCKNIQDNHLHQTNIAFFEAGRIWRCETDDTVSETKSLAGILFGKGTAIDFYEGKNIINQLCTTLGFAPEAITWNKVSRPHPWYHEYQIASVALDGHHFGTVGKIDPNFMSKLDIGPDGDAMIFELDLDFLLQTPSHQKIYKPLSKFQETFLDFSLLVPVTVTAQQLQTVLQTVDPLIRSVELIDSFEKKEWGDKRSLTFRCWVGNDKRTLEKSELDTLWHQATTSLESLGASIRTQ